MAGRASGSGATTRCSSCSAPILRQLVGHTAALTVTADLIPLTATEQVTVREPNRLIWCLYRAGPHTTPRLRWTGADHPAACPHPHVTEHRCPPKQPNTLF
ncbi:hypothetical protein ABT071_13745 [Streptomyces sp. NPDC002506]|uniref:hypothetical protein n=1 Tax=Streptomyces sp. NPDC002506 TaxID=3154536 RepID=UPI00331A28EA